ncbi:MAG: hypothetical protein MPW17_08225 [Candidatus Manganitrophus sp.]|nr:hypothetical protein [Candidatus Manganitrophus sp.]MDC4225904.1 hypothetical protein [Candidatus Manganitrophus sp.]WDT72810.1 MAG: hypothetical protein MPW17_08225 [Candidatus Manganitrophus sp.]
MGKGFNPIGAKERASASLRRDLMQRLRRADVILVLDRSGLAGVIEADRFFGKKSHASAG